MRFLTTLLLLSICTVFSYSFSQRYSYSFEGVSDSTSIAILAKEINKLEGVVSVKPRYKTEKKSGEFLIISIQDFDKRNPYPFRPTEVKELLLKNRLKPLVFREISSN